MSVSERPVIGVCAVRERARWSFWDQPAHLVADSYVAPLQRAGALAALLPVDTVAEGMAGPVYQARVNPGCRTCPVSSCCPVHPDGGEVAR